MIADDDTKNSVEPAERIVSVNSQGGPGSGIAVKLGLLVLVLASAVVGSAMAFQRYWAARSAENKDKDASSQLERPKTGPSLRHFSDIAPPPSAKAARTPPENKAVCDDGGPSHVLIGIDGKPMTASDGQAAWICQNGQLLFQQLTGTPAATSNSTTAQAAERTPAPAAPAASRYSGDVLLPVTPASTAFPTMQSTENTGALIPTSPSPPATAPLPATEAPTGNTVANPRGNLKGMLQAPPVASVQARLMGDRDLILPEGRTIDCNLSLRIISEVSGMAVCVLSSDVFGDSGNVVLAEKGSVATGDYVAFSAQGQRRLFITWTRLKTSKGILVNLNSPAADALGTSGLDGYVDNRWAERVGAAFLLSMVQDAIGYETARATAGNGAGNAATGIAVFQNTTEAGNRLAERILDSTINIKPTIYKNQGDRASITVARDLDFGSVYALRAK
ncbi:type IV secretion system protein VirB10 [Duganella sp. HH105]|uniref:type IV secretion system protein VirB10 n=1 Tax=Duganella sp. HH105 TaxID=1781067 RepID=UPI000877E25C|nr:type IV secretion system protein VirB10 [Duganella sp. HH105]OEZ54866.1 type IV secretion system protein virB10 [Duganella sp. HH105]